MKMVNQKKIAMILSISTLLVPMFVFAEVGIPCNGPDCTFDSLIILANNIIKFLMFKVAVPLAAIGFMWIGGKLVINQDKESAWSEARQGFESIIIGFFIMLGAFIFIKTALFAFLSQDQVSYVQYILQ